MGIIKRITAMLVLVGALGALALLAPSASSGPPPHGHLFITGLVMDETGEMPLSWKKCRPLANGEPVPNNAHHAHMHTGRAGEAQWNAGNIVVPMSPLTPYSSCQELYDDVFGSN